MLLLQTCISKNIINMTEEQKRRISLYSKRRYRRKSSKPQKLALIGIAAAVTIGAFLTLLNIEKQIDADSASSAQESETTVTAADAVAVNDIAEPEKIALISGNVTTADSVKLPDEIKQLLLDYTSDKYEYAGELNTARCHSISIPTVHTAGCTQVSAIPRCNI